MRKHLILPICIWTSAIWLNGFIDVCTRGASRDNDVMSSCATILINIVCNYNWQNMILIFIQMLVSLHFEGAAFEYCALLRVKLAREHSLLFFMILLGKLQHRKLLRFWSDVIILKYVKVISLYRLRNLLMVIYWSGLHV